MGLLGEYGPIELGIVSVVYGWYQNFEAGEGVLVQNVNLEQEDDACDE